MIRKLLVIGLATSLGVACGGDPDAQSGGDAYRNEAQPMPLEEWQVDDIALGEGDRTDWKAVDLAQPGKLRVELTTDEGGTTVRVAIYDRFGYPLGADERQEGEKMAQVVVDAKKPGRYFIMIRATGGDASSYQVRALMGGSSGGGGSSDLPDF